MVDTAQLYLQNNWVIDYNFKITKINFGFKKFECGDTIEENIIRVLIKAF